MKKTFACLLCFALIISCAACSQTVQLTKHSEYYFDYFDTVTTVIGYSETKEEFDDICAEIKGLLQEYHQLYTIYNRYDDLNNIVTINDVSEGTHSVVKVDKKIIDLLKFAKEMYAMTNGSVNVAMGSVLKIWHTYRNEGLDNPLNAQLPPVEQLKEAAEHTDIDKVIIDEENSTVYLDDPEMTLDVGAIAKGYAVEQIALYLENKGVSGYLLNVGGNVRSIGMAGDKAWNVGIENPNKEDTENAYIEYLHLKGESLVTSGSYQRFYTVDGVDYHHIIDPQTLMPGTKYRSVSVLTTDSGLGDALSTSLFLTDYESGKQLVESLNNVEAMWVMPDGEQRYSSGFKKYTYIP